MFVSVVFQSYYRIPYSIIAGSDPPEPEVTTQTILEMGYSRESLTEAMKKAETKG